MNLAVIPARGGSKRIPRKNVREFCGRPMIAYAINAAKESGLFDRVIVSSDDEDIMSIASQAGAETPFVRPASLADDHTPTVPVVAHAIESCVKLGWDFTNVCCIYPTVPFLQPKELSDGLQMLESNPEHYCFPVAQIPVSIQRAMRRLDNGRMEPFFLEFELTRTQETEPAYYDTGQFYWARTRTWLSKTHIHREGVGMPIPAWKAVDIDTPDDWKRAEIYYEVLTKKQEI